MLRDNSESFASDFSKKLAELGIKDVQSPRAFQLQKFERIEPDVFVWMLSGNRTYVVTIVDGGSGAPDLNWLSNWSGGVKVEDMEPLTPKGVDRIGYPGLKDGYDFVQVYRLPEDYDHTDLY